MSRPDPREPLPVAPDPGTTAEDDGAPEQPGLEALVERRTRRVSVLVALVVAGMVPWTAYLAHSLPARFDARNWNVLWAGFDVALTIVLAYTAWAAWFRRQIMVATALVAGTLLVCDAWFDVVTSFGTPDAVVSLVTAFAGELPLALFFFWLARRIMLRTVAAFHRATGAPGIPARLRDAPVLFASTRRQRPAPVREQDATTSVPPSPPRPPPPG